MKETANIKIQQDQIEIRNFYIRDIITKAMAESGLEVVINPKIDAEGRTVAEVITIYKIEKIALDNNNSLRGKY